MQKINFDVLNTLNLMNVVLGDAYLNEGYNPFDSDYIMTTENTEKLLNIPKQKRTIKQEEFLDNSNSNIAKNFEIAKINTDELLNELQSYNNKKIKDIIIFLKNRSKLLSEAIKKLKNKNVIAFEIYRDIVALNIEYSEILKQSFFEDFNKQVAIQNFLKLLEINILKPITIEPKQLNKKNKIQTNSTPKIVKEKEIEK